MEALTGHDATLQLERLQAVTAALSEAPTAAAIAEALAVQLTGLVGADAMGIFRLDAETGTLELLTAAGVDDVALRPHVRVGLDAELPAAEAVRERRAMWLSGDAAWEPYVAALRPTAPPLGTVGVVPIVADGVPLGSLFVTYGADGGLSAGDRRLVEAIAVHAAQALQRARLLEAADRATERLARLQRVTGALAQAATPEDVAAAIVGEARAAVGADVAIAYGAGADGGLELLAQDGLGPRGAERWRRLEPGVRAPAPDAARSGGMIVLESPEAIRAAYPDLDLTDAPVAAVIVAPLPAGEASLGVIAFGFAAPRHVGAEDRELVAAIARIGAQALERGDLHVATRAARDRAERLQATTAALASALTREDVARVVTTDGLAALGAVAGGLMALAAGGDELELLGVAGHAPPEVRRFARVPLDGPFLFAEAVRSGRARVVGDLAAMTARFPHLAAITGGRSSSGAIVPLLIGERAIGALAFGFAADRELDAERLTLLQTLAQLAAGALDRARLYEARHEVASRLQASLLPGDLPRLDDVDVAARYLAGTEDLEVGGDWYDVLELAEGRLGLAVGDVAGRGLQAASAMGRLRSALAALAPDCEGPGDLLERLDAFADRSDLAMATVAYAVLDSDAGIVDYACAGHPPPVLLAPGGSASLLDGGRSAPLGALPGLRRAAARAHVAPGSALLLYTDGLVERRGEALDDGLQRLAASAAAHAGSEPDALCAAVLADLVGGERPDDVAILCARTRVASPAPLVHRMPPDPWRLAGLRAALRGWLQDAGTAPDRARDVVLAVSELAANAVVHAGAGHLSVRVRRLDDGTIVASVHDDGRWRPVAPHPPAGRGLALARAVMDEVDVRPRPGGTTVVLRRR